MGTTYPVHVNREARARSPQVAETLQNQLLELTPHLSFTPKELHQRCRIIPKQMGLTDAYIRYELQAPQQRRGLRTLLVGRLLRGHHRSTTHIHGKQARPVLARPSPRRRK